MKCRFAFLALLLTTAALAQEGSISGKILDAATGEPLPFANVFLNNTTIGTVSEVSGDFILIKVSRPAVYELVVSFVGYESQKFNIDLDRDLVQVGEIRMKEGGIQLGTVEVAGKRDVDWEKKLKRFKDVFLGEDKFAAMCKIVNPWVIDFPVGEKGNKFLVEAHDPIEIENKMLGYKVFFYLTNFVADRSSYSILGNVRFEELQEQSQNERYEWLVNRRNAYLRSRQHLFKAIIDGRIKGEGFRVYTDVPGNEGSTTRSAIFNAEIGKSVKWYDTMGIVNRNANGTHTINLTGRVEVHYTGEKARVRTYRDVPYLVSWITLAKGYVIVNGDGVDLNPNDITVAGEMSDLRVANLLPVNYLPDEVVLAKKQDEINEAIMAIREQIYVHSDRPYYYPGESLWLKGYVNYSIPSLRDSLSQTVYVELLDPVKKIVKQSKILRITNGHFSGDFVLPDTMSTGTHYLRAYTNFNRNLGDQYLYMKPVPVLNLDQKADPAAGSVATTTGADEETIAIIPDKRTYKTRERVTLSIALTDHADQPIAGDLSVSVTDVKQVVPVPVAPDIMEAYTVDESIKPEARKNLYPIEYGLTLKGRFLNNKGKPEKAMLNVVQITPPDFAITESDEKGEFHVTGLFFYDSARFNIHATGKKNEPYGSGEVYGRDIPKRYYVDPDFSFPIQKAESVQRIASEYEKPADVILLSEVVVKAMREDEINTRRPVSYGRPDYIVKAEDLNTSYGNLLMTLPGKVPGLIIRQEHKAGEIPRWVVYLQRAESSSILFPREVLVMINDVAVGGNPGEILGAIDPTNVESVEINTSINSVLGSLGGSGYVNIITNRQIKSLGEMQRIKSAKVIGYTRPRDFRFPNYESATTDTSQPDYRSLLYWNPDVSVDADTGTTTASFFTADLPGTYRVTVEGVTAKGKPVRKVYEFAVESR